jgi:hypothetical protein
VVADQIGNLDALTDGYSAAFLGAAGVALAGALLAAVLLRAPKAAAADDMSIEGREALVA